MADLATFIEPRREPTGPGRDVLDRARRRHRRAATIATEDAATILLRFDERRARRGHRLARSAPAARTRSSTRSTARRAPSAWDSEQPDQLWLGHRDRPNEILIRNPALMGPAGRAAAALPGGHVEGFGDTFGALSGRSTPTSPPGGRPPRPAYPTFADGHDEMLVSDAIAESARLGRWVDVVRDPVAAVDAGRGGATR